MTTVPPVSDQPTLFDVPATERIPSGPMTIGVCKVGSDPSAPSPGAQTLVTIEDFLGDVLVSTFDLVWDGYTPAEVLKRRVKRWREARTWFEVDGNQAVYGRPGVRWQRLTFTLVEETERTNP